MSREPRSERAAGLAWAAQTDAQRRAALHPRSQPTMNTIPLHAAIAAHLQHGAAALADPGTDSLVDQNLIATVPAALDAPIAPAGRHDTGYPKAVPRPANARALAPSEATLARWARTKRLVDNARDEGHHTGLRTGYAQGWRWGLCCGAVAGVLLASIAWAGWLSLAAAAVAP